MPEATDSSSPATPPEKPITVLLALAANLLVALAKSAAAAVSGSASMVAEAAHSWVDAGNELFLLMAERAARRPATPSHPLGFGRAAYVWAMFGGFGLFTAGAVVSVMHGITALRGAATAGPPEDSRLAYAVLAVAFVLEGLSFLQAQRQVRAAALAAGMQPWPYVLRTSQTTLRSVYLEDAAALLGILVAAAGLWLREATGNAAWDAAGSIVVGLLLGAVAGLVIVRNAQFLVGEPGTPEQRERVRGLLLGQPGVAAVHRLHLEFVGPSSLLVVAAVELAGELTETELIARLQAIEAALGREPGIARCLLTLAPHAAA